MSLRPAALALLVFASPPGFCANLYRIVIVPRDGVHEFWHSVRSGAEQARAELAAQGINVELQWTAPAKENDAAAQIQALDDAIRRGVDGILLAPLDRKDLIPPVEAAAAKRIPVVTIDAGVDSLAPAAWVGSNNFEAGRMAGTRLGELLAGKGNVILLRHHIHSSNTEEREEGFLAAMHIDFPQFRLLVTDFHAGPTEAIARRVVPSRVGRYQNQLNGIFCSSECAGTGVLAELRKRNLAGGKVKYVAVEDEGGVLREAAAQGDAQGLILQDPEAMGSLAVKTMVAILRGTKPVRVSETALSLLPARSGATPGLDASPGPRGGRAAPSAPARGGAEGQSTMIVPELGLVLVAIPPGSFVMGSPTNARGFRDTDTASTRVTISRAFWLGKYETTQREWRRIMGGNPSDFIGELNPVDNVSWNDAAAFCRKLDEREKSAQRLPPGYHYSLPTEAEWEYACRAGTTGPRAGNLDDMGWYVGNSGSWVHPEGPLSRVEPTAWRMTTHPVGQKEPNAWGLYDMYGNVLEWCGDLYGPYSGSPVTDPRGAESGADRILRGGGWWTDPEVCFSFSRTKAPPGRHHNAMGFRLALDPETPAHP